MAGDLVAAGPPEHRKDGESLDLLHLRWPAVRPINRLGGRGADRGMVGQDDARGVGDAVLGGGVGIDQCGDVGPPVADRHDMGD
jgi:hypothetical protein